MFVRDNVLCKVKRNQKHHKWFYQWLHMECIGVILQSKKKVEYLYLCFCHTLCYLVCTPCLYLGTKVWLPWVRLFDRFFAAIAFPGIGNPVSCMRQQKGQEPLHVSMLFINAGIEQGMKNRNEDGMNLEGTECWVSDLFNVLMIWNSVREKREGVIYCVRFSYFGCLQMVVWVIELCCQCTTIITVTGMIVVHWRRPLRRSESDLIDDFERLVGILVCYNLE